MSIPAFSPETNIRRAISSYSNYCDGFATVADQSYILGIILGLGVSSVSLGHSGSTLLDEIVAFDRAEIDEAYLGQINMSTVSSFCGPQGIIWGYDLAVSSTLESQHPLLPKRLKYHNQYYPVYNVEPLTEATKALFGTVEKKRFPLIPGAHVPCAGKNKTEIGPKRIYSGIALGIPKNRSHSANLLMEDIGTITNESCSEELDRARSKILTNLATSVLKVGENQGIVFQEIFVGLKDIFVKEGEIGCALVAAPYFTLAQNAVPNSDPESLIDLSLQAWQTKVKKSFQYKLIKS